MNASVTNIVFSPLMSEKRGSVLQTVVKPTRAERQYTFTTQLEASQVPESRFARLMNATGFPSDALEAAALSLQQPAPVPTQDGGESNDELWKVINEQRELQQLTYRKYVEAQGQGS